MFTYDARRGLTSFFDSGNNVTPVLVACVIAITKYLTKAFKDRRVYVGSQFAGLQSIMAGKPNIRQGLVQRQRSDECWCSIHFLLLFPFF